MKHAFLITLFLLLFFQKAIASGPSYWEPVNPQADSLIIELEKRQRGDEEVPDLLTKLKQISDSTNDPVVKSRYLYWHAYFSNTERYGVTDSLYPQLYEAIQLIDTAKYKYDYARIRYLLFNPVKNKEDYVEQYKISLELVQVFHEAGDIKYEAALYRQMGILMSDLEKYETALEYLEKANELYGILNRKDYVATNMINISVVYEYMDQTDMAISTLENVIKNDYQYLDTLALSVAYGNYARLQKDEETKEEYTRKSYELIKEYGKSPYNLATTQQNMGDVYYNKGQLDSAFMFYMAAHEYAEKSNTSRLIIPSLLGIANTYAKRGDYINAYMYMEQYQLAKDSIIGVDKLTEINRIQADVEIQKYRDQLIIEQQKSEIQKKENTIWGLTGVGILLILVFILIYIWQKKKLTDKSLRNEELQNKNLRQKIDLQNRELSTTSLVLNEKNVILNNILTHIKNAYNNDEMTRKCESSLRKLILDNLQTEDEWNSFKLHFEKVHPDFFRNLKEKHSELSENELKFCAYIRIGLSSKQISQILSILPATVKTNRYLLRKKFDLETAQSLDDYIRTI